MSSRNPPHGMKTHIWQRTSGESNPRAKMTEQRVRIIRRGVLPIPVVAEVFQVSSTTIRRIRTGQAWGHVDA